MKSVHDIRSRKPLRPNYWFLFLGILQTRMGPSSKKKNTSKLLILYTVSLLIKELALKMDWYRVTVIWRFWKWDCYLDMKIHNKSEFYEEIFLLSYTDLFFPLFVLISLHRKDLINIPKIETNLSYNLPKSISNIKRAEFAQYMKCIISNNKKGLANSYNLYTFSHIVIILDPAGKHMVKAHDKH